MNVTTQPITDHSTLRKGGSDGSYAFHIPKPPKTKSRHACHSPHLTYSKPDFDQMVRMHSEPNTNIC